MGVLQLAKSLFDGRKLSGDVRVGFGSKVSTVEGAKNNGIENGRDAVIPRGSMDGAPHRVRLGPNAKSATIRENGPAVDANEPGSASNAGQILVLNTLRRELNEVGRRCNTNCLSPEVFNTCTKQGDMAVISRILAFNTSTTWPTLHRRRVSCSERGPKRQRHPTQECNR